jgi:DNA-3-methyladenine glycosylase I
MTSYCEVSKGHHLHGPYHDLEYGFPLQDDQRLFERLVLEINQAGLSWVTILKKKDAFRQAFHSFDIEKVASYRDKDRQRLLNDSSIIRNRLKIDAVIANANTILTLQQEFGSFQAWLDAHHPLPKDTWVKLFKKTFRFTGIEITNEFLMSTGYLPGAHHDRCPIYRKIEKLKPAWMRT